MYGGIKNESIQEPPFGSSRGSYDSVALRRFLQALRLTKTKQQ